MHPSYRERMLRIVDELAAQGVRPSTSAPPYCRIAWRLGLQVRPPLYQSFASLALGMGAWFGIGFGLLTWLFFRTLGSVPLGYFAILVLASGVFFGLTMATFYRWRARRLDLPPLRAEWRKPDQQNP